MPSEERNTDSGRSHRRAVLSARKPKSGWISDEVTLAMSTITPVAVYVRPSAVFRYGSSAESEPWFVSMTRCPSASSPSSL